MRYIAVDFFRTQILLEAASKPELNQKLLSWFAQNHFSNTGVRIYQMQTEELKTVKREMQNKGVPFYAVTKPRK